MEGKVWQHCSIRLGLSSTFKHQHLRLKGARLEHWKASDSRIWGPQGALLLCPDSTCQTINNPHNPPPEAPYMFEIRLNSSATPWRIAVASRDEADGWVDVINKAVAELNVAGASGDPPSSKVGKPSKDAAWRSTDLGRQGQDAQQSCVPQ